MLKCGHPSCHTCFPVFFKINPKCNYCRMPGQIEEKMTQNNERLFRSKSLTAEMYENAVIRCLNAECKLEFSIDEINTHEFFECRIDLLSVRRKVATTRAIITKCTNMRFSVRFFNSTAQLAIWRTVPKYSSIALRLYLNAAYWNLRAVPFPVFQSCRITTMETLSYHSMWHESFDLSILV